MTRNTKEDDLIMKPAFTLLIALLLAWYSGDVSAAPQAGNLIPDANSADVRREAVMKNCLSHPLKGEARMVNAVPFAVSAYWLNEHLPEADAATIRAASPELAGVVSKKDQGSEEAKHYYRDSYLLERLYFLFNSRSEYFPGRMSKAAEDAVAAVLWKWASKACTKTTVRPENMWWNGGSENILGRNTVSLWGAAQIFATHPDYRDRKYADGTPVPEMAQAFNDYYKHFTRQRASKGVMLEVASGYDEYTLNAWYNIADFSPDAVTRQRMKMFLDLFWADYAIEQINGMRGGSRHRCYPGPSSIVGGGGGAQSAWNMFGFGKSHPLSPKTLGAATTFYRPSPVVEALAKAGAARGTYEYVSRRLGKGTTAEQVGKPKGMGQESAEGDDSDEKSAGGKPAKPAQDSKESKGSKNSEPEERCIAPNGGDLLRYTYCTPDFVLGTSMVPALPLDAWTPISSQNRWEGVIFAGNPTARVFPQTQANDGKHAYNASWSVQSKGVMIAQRLKTSKGAKGQRVWFDASLKRVEQDGWVFAEAPQAYAAVRVVDGGSRWEELAQKSKKIKAGGVWLRCENEYSPVIIDVARKSDYPDFTAFQKAILANALTWKDKKLDYRSDLYKTQLTLFADYSKPPQVNGVPINYSPAKCYDSPFIQGDWGSGVVTIRKDQRELVLDFTKD